MSTTEFAQAQQRMLTACGVRAQGRFVDVPAIGGRAHVLVAGDGPPVMMVIGGTVPAAMWAPLMARLSGFTVHVVDLPSHGQTDRASFATDRMRPMLTGFLSQVMTGLGLDRAPFVGQSMGGLFSTWLALDEPERVSSLSLIGCPAFLLGTCAPLPLRLMSIPALGRLMTRMRPPSPGQVDQVAKTAGQDLTDLPELRALMLAHERIPHFSSDVIELLHACITIKGARPELALTEDQIAQISQPVQLIWGDNDTFGPASVGHRAAEIIPDARMHTVPGGHAPWLDSGDQIAALVDPFLRRHSITAPTSRSQT